MISNTIFTYLDPVALLQDKFNEKKKRNKSFSLRAWCKILELKEPTPIAQILKGKRPIPLHYIPKLSKSLKLTPLEEEHLEAIIQLKCAASSTEKELWTIRLQDIFIKATHNVSWIEHFEMFHTTIPMILLELVNLDDFQYNPAWVKKKLLLDVSHEKIKEVYENLITYGFLNVDSSGKLKRTHRHVSSKHDISSIWVKKFHQNALEQATTALYQQDVNDREFASYVLSIKQSDLKKIKLQIRSFTEKLIHEFSTESRTPDCLYHLNVNIFAQTKIR